MLIHIIKSNRGGNIAVHNGYCYNQKQVTLSCIHWRCTKYYSIKCLAVLKTNQNVFISLKDSHTHESDVWFDQAQTYGCFYGIWRKIRKGRNLNTFKRRLESFVSSAPVMKKSKNRCKSYKVATLSRTSCLICEQSPTLDENNSYFFYMIHFCECVFEIRVFDRE